MDVAVHHVGVAASVALLGDEHLTGGHAGTAPAALAAAAQGGGGETGTLDGDEQRLVGGGGDLADLTALPDRQLEGLALGLGGITGQGPGLLDSAEDLVADVLFVIAQLGKLSVDKVVHGLGAAHKDGHFLAGGVLFDELTGDEAVLEAFLLLVGQDVDHVDLVAGGADLVQLLAVDDALFLAGAEEDGQVKVLHAVTDGAGHAHEGGDTGTAGQGDDLLAVTDGLIVQMALGRGDGQLLAYLPVLVDVGCHEAAGILLDGDVVDALKCQSGRAAEGVGTGGLDVTDLQAQRDVLAGTEGGQRFAVGGLEHQRLGVRAVGDDLAEDHFLTAGMIQGRLGVGGVGLGQGISGGLGDVRFTHLRHLLEFQHIQKADLADLDFQCHITYPPLPVRQGPSCPSCRR